MEEVFDEEDILEEGPFKKEKKKKKAITSKRDVECIHRFWIKRCSTCKAILESDSQVNQQPGKKERTEYSDFIKLVPKLQLCKKINELELLKGSKLNWVIFTAENIATLRTEGHSHNDVVSIPAPTVSEICMRLRKFPRNIIKSGEWEKLGKNMHRPNSVGRFLLKVNKRYQKTLQKDTE